MVRQTASTIILEIIGGLILLALLAVGVLAFMLANGPVELGIFRDNVEQALSDTRDGRPVNFDKVYLEWSPSQKRVTVTADGVVFKDTTGEVGATAKRAEIVLDASSLIFGKIEPLNMHLQSGELLAEQTDKGWSVAGEPPIPINSPQQEEPISMEPAVILEAANSALQSSLGTLKSINNNLTLEAVSFEDFVILARDKNNEEVFKVLNAQGSMTRSREEVSFALKADGGVGLPSTLNVSLSAPPSFETVEGEIGLEGWSMEALIEQFDLPEDILNGNIQGLSVNARATVGGGLQEAGLNLSPSQIALGAQNLEFEELGFDARYNVDADELDLDIIALKHERVSGPLKLQLSDVINGQTTPRDFKLSSPDLNIDLSEIFPKIWSFQNVGMKGQLHLENRQVDFDSLSLDTDGFELRANGKGALLEKRTETDLPFSLEMTAKLTGPLTTKTVLDYWPERLGQGARNFVDQRIIDATITEVNAATNIRQDSFAQNYLADEALALTFSATDVTLKPLNDVPSIFIPAGTGRMTGNSIRVTASEGKIATVEMSEGVYEIPRMNPKGGDFRIFAKAKGPVRDIVQIVSDSRLQLQANTGFDPAALSGDAEGELELFRPALKKVEPGALRFTVKGSAKKTGLKSIAYGIDLTDASTRIDIDQNSMTIAGFGQWGALPVQFTWRDGFNDNNAPSSLSASSIVDPDVLNRFGFLGRTYLAGEAPVEIQALTNGSNVQEANIAVDLQEARVDISEIGWIKPAGEPARARITYKPQNNSPAATAYLEADDLLIDGDFVLGEKNKIMSANIRRAFVDELADVNGTVRREDTGRLNIDLKGDFLDISGAVGGFGGEESIVGDVSLNANVDKLRLRGDIVVGDATVALKNNAQGLHSFNARGALSDKSIIDIGFDGSNTNAPKIEVSSGNAGFLTESFLGSDFLEGGEMTISGVLASGDLPTKLNVNITDARLRDAPFLTQILSLASLRGLADTFTGEGVLFSSIEVPLTITGDRYSIDGARAQGPALGLTANGWLRTDGQAIRVDGVLVPSFGINSALGGVPILGDLFVSRDGEGVFSLTYGVRGSLAEANVSVNPLSAITPGVLRRVFENPAEEPLPKGDPTKPPPPPVAPLPPPEEF